MTELDQSCSGGLTELRLSVESPGGALEALAWVPRGASGVGRIPVVLLGHGGSGHKAIERHRRFGVVFARHRVAALAIDGPFHGDRSVAGDGPLGYQQRVIRKGPLTVHLEMSRDWLAALDALAESQEDIDADRVGFLGLSMGSRYGLAPCAELGHRLRAAVIGKFGLASEDAAMTAMTVADLNLDSARAMTAPVLQHIQWHDEVFTLEGQLRLFDAFTSAEKVLRARPGGHHLTREGDEEAWIQHLVRHL